MLAVSVPCVWAAGKEFPALVSVEHLGVNIAASSINAGAHHPEGDLQNLSDKCIFMRKAHRKSAFRMFLAQAQNAEAEISR